MRLIGCDLHASQQSIAMLDRDTGMVVEKTLRHEGETVRTFYASIPPPVVVGIEATGSMGWFLRLRGLDQVTIDGVVVAFTAVIGGVSALIFGLIPAFQTARTHPAIGVAATARATQGRGQRRLRGALVIAETAIGVVLLVCAGLLLRSFDRLIRTSPGFDPRHVVTARFRLPDSRYSYSRQIAFYDDLVADLRALQSVESAAN